MAYQWTTVAPGIRAREHETRKHGVKPDRYFVLRHCVDGKRVEEALGWASDGWTLKRAQDQLARLREAGRKGEGEKTLKEKRESADAKRKAEESKVREEERRAADEARRNVTLSTYTSGHKS